MPLVGYAHSAQRAQQHAPIIFALAEYVEAIRDATYTRTGQDERRLTAAEDALHKAVYDYALARRSE